MLQLQSYNYNVTTTKLQLQCYNYNVTTTMLQLQPLRRQRKNKKMFEKR
jgi:hypothetical protein